MKKGECILIIHLLNMMYELCENVLGDKKRVYFLRSGFENDIIKKDQDIF